jgi:hypothetical protein
MPPPGGMGGPRPANRGYDTTSKDIIFICSRSGLDMSIIVCIMRAHKEKAMKVEMITKRVASRRVRKSSGIHAVFVKINQRWGYKYFYEKEMRDMNYEIMSNLAEKGVAAKVGQKMDVVINGATWYGFIIEVCKPCVAEVLKFNGFESHLSQGHDYFLCAVTDGRYYQKFMDAHPDWKNRYANLRVKCRKANFCWDDDHAGNWGLTSKGEPVIFDVSVESENAMYDDENYDE